jgi:hypothetical protein
MRLVVLCVAACGLCGCGSFAFYEDTKVAIALSLDPSAPDPVEVSAAFKEAVYALAPVKQQGNVMATGPILADFDVRYGVNANATTDSLTRDVLYAVITHGLATGQAAVIRNGRDGLARKAVVARFIDGLGEADLRTAATALSLDALGSPTELRQRIGRRLRETPEGRLGALEAALRSAFPHR